MDVLRLAKEDAEYHVVEMAAKGLVALVVIVLVSVCAVLAVPDVFTLQNKQQMRKILLFIVTCICSACVMGQEDYVLETRFRNPVDTAKFHESPTMLLFVHSKCQHGHLCPTTRMQRALETDSLGFRSKFGIKLYVIYPEYSQYDINTFDSFSPAENTVVAFYVKRTHKGTFHESGSTPHIVFYDGNNHIRTKIGGNVEELKDSVCNKWRGEQRICRRCWGRGSVTPVPRSGDPDLAVGICPMCRGKKTLYQSYY